MKTTPVAIWNKSHAGNIWLIYCNEDGEQLQDGFVTYSSAQNGNTAYGEDINASQLAYFELQAKTA